jgi:predicted phage-related endonuclease
MPREGYLTASLIAAAAGLNPYESRQECARILMGIKVKEPFAAGEWGNDQEDLTLRTYEALTGNLITGEQSWFEREYIGCHIDGLVLLESERIIVEAKSPVSAESFEKNYQEPPSYYVPQVQVQMALAGASLAHFVARFGDDARVWRIEPSLEYFEKLKSELDWFWGHVKDGVVPPRRAKPKMPPVAIERMF